MAMLPNMHANRRLIAECQTLVTYVYLNCAPAIARLGLRVTSASKFTTDMRHGSYSFSFLAYRKISGYPLISTKCAEIALTQCIVIKNLLLNTFYNAYVNYARLLNK